MSESISHSPTKKQTSERIKTRKKMSKAQMQLAIIKKKQCDAKALIIVERLLEPIVESQWLLQNLQYINKSHMEDVIEERAIVKLCGYVLCQNILTVIITQQFHISTKRNKVYDVTRRKNFCSPHCYGACNYLLDQMLTSPLWLREKEEIPVFQLLPSSLQAEKNMLGDEVFVGGTDFLSDKEGMKYTEKDEQAQNHTIDKEEGSHNQLSQSDAAVSNVIFNEDNSLLHISVEDSVLKNVQEDDSNINNNLNRHQDLTQNEEALILTKNNENSIKYNEGFIEQDQVYQQSCELSALTENLKTLLNCDKFENVIESKSNTHIIESTSREEKKMNEVVTVSQNSSHIEEYSIENKQDHTHTQCENIQNMSIKKSKRNTSTRSMKKTKSKDSEESSIKFYTLTMRVEESVKEWITEDTLSFLQGGAEIRYQLMESFTQRERYLQLCKKLNRLQIEDEKEDRADLANNVLKPLPHYSILREEANKLELKVRAFYEGRMVTNPPEKVIEHNDSNESCPVLPLMDAHAPKALRRKIFLDKLHKILPDLLRMLAGATRCYTIIEYIHDNSNYTLAKGLINTFALSASNIVFKTAEWTLVGLIIIKMLSIIDPQLKTLLTTKQASMYISMVLMSYKLDSYYLDRFIIELTNNPNIFEIK